MPNLIPSFARFSSFVPKRLAEPARCLTVLCVLPVETKLIHPYPNKYILVCLLLRSPPDGGDLLYEAVDGNPLPLR